MTNKQRAQHVLQQIKKGQGLNPKDLRKFMDLKTVSTISKLDKFIPVFLFLSYLTFLTIKNYYGEKLGDWGTVPLALHAFLQSIHDVSGKTAEAATWQAHMIPFLFEASIAWGLLKTLPDWITVKSRSARVLETQNLLREQLKDGKVAYKMARNHTAAFVGNGDKLATRLQEVKPMDEVMQYANMPLDKEVWQYIKPDATEKELFQILDRGNLISAGEILIMPVKSSDMFLPGIDGHDMMLDEVEGIINMVDDYCESKKVAKKRIIIIGNKYMPQVYHSRQGARKYEESKVTLEDLVNRIKSLRAGADLIVDDPTQLVMKKIVDLAQGRSIEFYATQAGDKRYGEQFYDLLDNKLKYKPSVKKKVRVLYDIIDTPTEVRATPEGDIAVILDHWRKESMIKKGITEENIIVVPDLVLTHLSQRVEES